MRNTLIAFLVALAGFIPSTTLQAADTTVGSGFVIGSQGEILTNAHVVENCESITIGFPSGSSEIAVLIAHDQKNDLAVVRTKNQPSLGTAAFREGAPVRAGDTVVALGYPLSGILASNASLSVGNVSALAGLGDDSRYLQISAPVQPGNSGGPLLDTSGHLVGIVTAKLDAALVARVTGDIPQNVNFALKAELARTFLDSKGISYRAARSDQQLSTADVGDIARPFTVHIECRQAASRVAAPTTSALPPRNACSGKQRWDDNVSTIERFHLPGPFADARLRFEGRVGDVRIPPGQISFELYKGSEFEPGNNPISAGSGEVISVPEGSYHIVSHYGDANSTVRSDLCFLGGRLTDMSINHRAATITFKLINERGRAVHGNTQWSVLTKNGDTIKELIGDFPRVILAEGEYRAIARNDNKTYEGAFRVVAAVDGEVVVSTGARPSFRPSVVPPSLLSRVPLQYRYPPR
jgi:S1-C subfamily serine protease